MDRKNPKIANLEHLPKLIKDGLELIRDLVVEMFQPEMIILFGSLTTTGAGNCGIAKVCTVNPLGKRRPH